MSKWLDGSRKAKKEEPEDLETAYRFGAETGKYMAQEIDEFIETRGVIVGMNFLNVLRERLQLALKSTEAPALFCARIEYRTFVEQVDDMPDRLANEAREKLCGWLKVARTMEVLPTFHQLIEKKVGDFCESLKAEGLKVVGEYAIPLKDADDFWRNANPELCKHFPDPDDEETEAEEDDLNDC